jgi:hypothetical protein
MPSSPSRRNSCRTRSSRRARTFSWRSIMTRSMPNRRRSTLCSPPAVPVQPRLPRQRRFLLHPHLRIAFGNNHPQVFRRISWRSEPSGQQAWTQSPVWRFLLTSATHGLDTGPQSMDRYGPGLVHAVACSWRWCAWSSPRNVAASGLLRRPTFVLPRCHATATSHGSMEPSGVARCTERGHSLGDSTAAR